MYKNTSLRLLLFLAITDFLHAFTSGCNLQQDHSSNTITPRRQTLSWAFLCYILPQLAADERKMALAAFEERMVAGGGDGNATTETLPRCATLLGANYCTANCSKRCKFSALPYTIYLTVFCVSLPINLNPHFIMFSSTPLTIQLKLKLTLIVAIALQKTLVRFTLILR